MQEQKKYHQRKLEIIEIIEECDRCIKNTKSFIRKCNPVYKTALNIHFRNIERYESIRNRLSLWLGE